VATLDRDGFHHAYEVTGPTDGPAILFTHGFSATGQMWSTTAAALADRHRCITWDLRGHGASDAPDGPDRYSPELALADMEALLDAAAVDRAVLVGHSLGGYLSLRFHRGAPDRVAALVLVDTGPGYRNEEARAGWNDMCEDFAVGFETNGLDALEAGSPEVAAASHRSATGLVHAARRILTQHDAAVVDHLPAIDVATLVVVGSKDRPFLAGSEYMAAKIPGATLVVVDGAGHAPMLTHPDTFQHELATFLSR
jgi:pimeloyl-ACP methyl ester carboxylesterase